MAEDAAYIIKDEYLNGYACPICGQRLFGDECKFCDYKDCIAVLTPEQAKIHKDKLVL